MSSISVPSRLLSVYCFITEEWESPWGAHSDPHKPRALRFNFRSGVHSMCCLQLPYGLIKEISSPGKWRNGNFKSFFTRFCSWWQIQVLVIQTEERNKYLVLIQLFLGTSCRFIAKPCAINLGIQDSGPHRAQPNAILEKVFTSITKVSHASNSSSVPQGMEAWKCCKGGFLLPLFWIEKHFTFHTPHPHAGSFWFCFASGMSFW